MNQVIACSLCILVSISAFTEKAAAASSPETGKASWYGAKWHGRKTASGERYNMESMTAAHKRLPFGSLVRVTRVDCGKSTIVRINNRGPYCRGRVIDLSKAAARKLGMLKDGVAKVRLEVLETPKNRRSLALVGSSRSTL